ncbi:arf-GAP with Rho-GAP domain, ANK repeat and PH domain-containing protein 1 isoform X2 [Echeneis naucrates]|uniref:arf-GAP with Rho-GAP domain, ANK repeat and PH domain-containing protein 1 isoform X2 n=1 Tax=Echeneis naucrates TaxID=173247 RepID=UPI0011142A92|nr:arf-GAP with Rho-GAP domain, ANK repeat and PH domain-containing protein 1-like isoform X2 [Echeneis naucrates]
MTPPPPVPKPRARYIRDSLSSTPSLDRNENIQVDSSNDIHLSTDEGFPPLPPPSGPGGGVGFPTLSGVTDLIANNIPSLAGVVTTIRGATPQVSTTPSAPSSIDKMANIVTHIPSLVDAASSVASPVASTSATSPLSSTTHAAASTVSLDSILSSLANIPSLAEMANTATSSSPSVLPPPSSKPHPQSLPQIDLAGNPHTDIPVLSQLVISSLGHNAGASFPPGGEAADNRDPEDDLYVTMLACWTAEEPDTDSSNEEEESGVGPTPSRVNEPKEGDPASNLRINPNSPADRILPTRPAPPPPRPPAQSQKPGKHVIKKTPRAATIRVSRKKGSNISSPPLSAVVRSGWLDVWKGFRHSVLWATLDGQLMSLWKKRTDRFSEVLFHVSSITNVRKQDKGRFSIFFRKKHYDFMAHNDELQDGWVTSLVASRGQPGPAPPKLQGQITMKDPRSRVYAAIWGQNLWIYPSKDSYQLGVASFSVPLNVASVKVTGKHSFSLITPFKSFSLSVDSSKDLSLWLDSLSVSIQSALSCSQVATRLLENPDNKVCGDCGSTNPEWASVNLLLVICQACAGQHRSLGSKLSKVRSLMMDSKVWTEPLIQLFVLYGNRLANQVWAATVPAAEQLLPDASDEERSKFILDKYSRGRYRRVHALTSSASLMDQRLCEVVCGDDIEETMSLICSGAKVCQSDLQSPAPILLAERAGQALQTELLRLNEYTEFPRHQPQSAIRRPSSTPSGEEEEELHGKLEEDRFLFSLENDSAACDVLDLREILSVFVRDGPAHEFEMVTLSDQLICAADDRDALLTHLIYILKVILPGGVSYAEVCMCSAVSKVCVVEVCVEVGGASSDSDAWLLLWEDGVSVHPINRHSQMILRMDLSVLSHHEMALSENIITMATENRSISLRFEEPHSCQSWFRHLRMALTNQSSAPQRPPAANQRPARQSLYPLMDMGSRGSVPPGIERCISHITAHGLTVEGVYRRCGLTAKVNRLVDYLMTSPNSAPLETDEQGVLDASSALKQYVRQQQSLIPDIQPWLQAAVISDDRLRFKAYQRLLWQLPDDNRATLSALFGHFYIVQKFSQVNKMSAQNLAVVLLPSLFQTLNQDLLRLTREFIIHHTLLFLRGKRIRSQSSDEN